MRRLVLRHELLRCLPKMIALVFALTGVVHGVVVYFSEATTDSEWLSSLSLHILQACVFLSAALVFTMPSAGHRCRPWELTLPLPGRALSRSHRHALLLGGVLVMLAYAPLPILIWSIDRNFDRLVWLDAPSAGLARICWDIWGLPLVFWLVSVDVVTRWWPAEAHPGSLPAWRRRILILVFLMTGALLLVGLLDLTLLVVWLPLPVALWNRRRAVPESLILSAPGDRQPDIPANAAAQWGPTRSAWMADRMVARTVFKWPAHWLVMPSLAVLYGVFLSGNSPIGEGSALLRFGHVFMAAYMMVAGAGFLLEKLHLVDHLPISRARILGWLVWPLVLAVVIGYGLGTLEARLQDDPVERLAFVNSSEGYGLKVPPRIFEVIRATEPPEIVAPWGERHRPESTPVFKGLPWIIYKPYTTPEGASARFVRWQLARAVEAAYGQPWDEMGLFREIDGRVLVRDEGLRLAAEHPHWQVLPEGPVFPALLATVLMVLFAGMALLFAVLRRQAGLLRTRVAFWSLMAFYLALHLGGLALFMAGFTDDWIIEGVVLGALSRLQYTSLGAHLLAYGVLILVAGGGWSLVRHRFSKLEACR